MQTPSVPAESAEQGEAAAAADSQDAAPQGAAEHTEERIDLDNDDSDAGGYDGAAATYLRDIRQQEANL